MSFHSKESTRFSNRMLHRNIGSDARVEMTSMVDVTFLLLIFFMVTATFTLQRAIAMPNSELPSTVTQIQDDTPPPEVTVKIDAFGGFLVLAPSWDREVLGKQSLVSALKQASAEQQDDDRVLMIVVHEDSKLQTLVDAIDAGTIAGYASLQVEQVDFIR